MRQIKASKKYFAIAIVLFLSMMSLSRSVDNYLVKNTDTSIVEVAATYAIARGINAIVSVLQSSEIGASVGAIATIEGSVDIGEALDPINDLVERFSNLVSVALGSLFLQKFLLGVVANDIFKYLVLFFALLTTLSLFFNKYDCATYAIRFFAFTVFVKLLLVFVVILNSFIVSLSPEHNTTKEVQNFEDFEQKIISNISGNKAITTDYKKNLKHENKNNLEKIVILYDKTKIIEASITSYKIKKSYLKTIYILKLKKQINNYCSWYWLANKECKNTKNILSKKESLLKTIIKNIEFLTKNKEENKQKIKKLEQKINHNKNKMSGKIKLDWWEGIKKGVTNIDIDDIDNSITEYIDTLFTLLAVFLLKTILVPILFFYVFTKGVKRVWNVDFSKAIK